MTDLTPNDTQDPKLVSLLGKLGELIRQARQKVLRAVDTVQVQTCWQMGRYIVEFEQKEELRNELDRERAAFEERLTHQQPR
jgi:hypothetical protein